MHQPATLSANRTIADADMIEICVDLEAHAAAMT